jgi:hypothetical protein
MRQTSIALKYIDLDLPKRVCSHFLLAAQKAFGIHGFIVNNNDL